MAAISSFYSMSRSSQPACEGVCLLCELGVQAGVTTLPGHHCHSLPGCCHPPLVGYCYCNGYTYMYSRSSTNVGAISLWCKSFKDIRNSIIYCSSLIQAVQCLSLHGWWHGRTTHCKFTTIAHTSTAYSRPKGHLTQHVTCEDPDPLYNCPHMPCDGSRG